MTTPPRMLDLPAAQPVNDGDEPVRLFIIDALPATAT
jgi:hypothetical protein